VYTLSLATARVYAPFLTTARVYAPSPAAAGEGRDGGQSNPVFQVPSSECISPYPRTQA
jgi:hypothetical protein